jgi:inhibitor of cysteine peptidase
MRYKEMRKFKGIFSALGVMAILGGTLMATDESKEKAIFAVSQGSETRISVKTSQDFCLKIESNPSTGYGWELDQPLDETMLELVGRDVEQPRASTMAGAPQFEIWAFRALKTGETTIFLKYVRPWEKYVAPLKTHKFILLIQ